MHQTTLAHVQADWAYPDRVPVLEGQPVRLTDPRILLGLHRALLGTPGVVAADLLPYTDPSGPAVFVVATSDAPLPDPVLDGLKLGCAELHGGSVQFRLAWFEGGGIKVALASLKLKIV